MKKLLSLTLVLTMLFTIVSISSVSAEDIVGESLESGYVTVFKNGLENGFLFEEVDGKTFNCYVNGRVGGANANGNNRQGNAPVDYPSSIGEPQANEDFGNKLMRVMIPDQVESYTRMYMRCPLTLANSYAPKKGKTYRASVWVYLAETMDSNKTSGNFILRIGNGGTNVAANSQDGKEGQTVTKGRWTKLSVEFIPTADYTKGLRYEIETTVPKTVYLDNFRLEEVHTDDFGLTIKEDGDNVVAVGTVNDTIDAKDAQGIVIIAAYDDQERLVGVSTSTSDGVSIEIGDSATATYTKDPTANESKYIAFFWNNLTAIRPLVASEELGN